MPIFTLAAVLNMYQCSYFICKCVNYHFIRFLWVLLYTYIGISCRNEIAFAVCKDSIYGNIILKIQILQPHNGGSVYLTNDP